MRLGDEDAPAGVLEGRQCLLGESVAKKLESAAFEACTTSKKFESVIKTNFDDGAAMGVTGTPAFFINGRMLVGAQPIEQFRQIINDELSRKGVSVPKTGAGTN